MSSLRSRANFAAAVSRKLRAAGIRPLPSGTSRMREGVRVTTDALDNTANVSVDIDLPRKAARIANQIEEVLVAAGYTVSRNPHDELLMTVTREGAR